MDWTTTLLILSVVLFIALFVENVFLFVTIRSQVLREFQVWFLRKRGYGLLEILHSDRMREYKVVQLHTDNYKRAGKDHEENYIFDPQGFTFRQDDKTPVATFRHDIPTQVDLYAEQRTYIVDGVGVTKREMQVKDENGNPMFGSDGKAIMNEVYSVKLPRADWNTNLTATKIASYLVKMRFLAKDFFKKYYIIIMLGILLVLIVSLYNVSNTQSKIQELQNAGALQYESLKGLIQQQHLLNGSLVIK